MKTIRMEQVWATIQPLIPSYLLFSNKPLEEDTSDDTYIYPQLVSDNITQSSFQWYMQKEARVQFTIVCKNVLWVNETVESVLFDFIDALNTAIAREACNKINTIDNLTILEIQSSTLSPIFYNEKKRAYIVKDFIFQYEW